jgi:hypothetical protein
MEHIGSSFRTDIGHLALARAEVRHAARWSKDFGQWILLTAEETIKTQTEVI